MRYSDTNISHDGHRRCLSLLLCLVMLLGIVQAFPATASDGTAARTVTIKQDGKEVGRLTLPENERTELTAECTPAANGAEYQWQISADMSSDTWVDIYDGTSERLAVSYAMLQSLLDASGSAYVRCRATAGEAECVSSPVCITVEFIPTVVGDTVSGQQTASAAPKRSPRRVSTQSDGDEQLISITINYLDGVSGLPIYSSYTGHVNVSVEDYKATVISPTYLGYAPKYNKNAPASTLPADDGDHSWLFPDSAETIELNITKDTEPIYVVNVYYFAINVPYSVRFYFQNIHDDLYTENVGMYKTDTAKTGTIISNEKLAELAGADATVGFTKLYHYPEAVAADGSTVFECYYDRNYRMLKFDANGGYGVEPIYARYGTPFLVNDPTYHGYVFKGWDKLDASGNGDGKADPLPSTVPDENCTYVAIWETAKTTYDVAYWLQNADDDDYSYIGTIEVSGTDSGTTVTPADAPILNSDDPICGIIDEPDHEHSKGNGCYALHAKHYILDDEKNKDISVVVKGDGSSILNVYYTRKYYTLRFIYAKENSSGSSTSYSVVGGSTYGFGNITEDRKPGKYWFSSQYGSSTKDYTMDELLAYVSTYNGGTETWGEVTALPKLNDPAPTSDGTQPRYVTGVHSATDSSGDRYHYFEITARYGADLTNLWPASVFDKVKVKNPSSHTANKANENKKNNGWGNYAYLAGWNGEFKVQYSIVKDNTTVKGLYQKLDDTVLLGTYAGNDYSSEYNSSSGNVKRQITTQTTVGGTEVNSNVCYYLAFFDNGANVSWSIPREWIYELYVPVFEHDIATGSTLYNSIVSAARNGSVANRTYTDTETNTVYYYHNNKIYRRYSRIVASDDNTVKGNGDISGQTQTVLTGYDFETSGDQFEQFQNSSCDDGRLSYTSRFFYTRDAYTLTLHNHGSVYDRGNLDFESEIDDFMTVDGELKVPDYPKTLEENAYYFDGWYASPECVDGTEYTAGKHYKMPAVNFSLYAKWAPKTHTVRFFRTHNDLLNFEATGITDGLLYEFKVLHGLVINTTIENPKDESKFNYTFGGWFYDYSGKRLAYTPLDSPVLRDMNVFAAWGSLTAQPYRIHYALDTPESDTEWLALLDDITAPLDNIAYTVTRGAVTRKYIYLASDGKFHLSIADDTDGFAYQGSTRTFSPKVGDPYNQLHSGYNKGFYPTVASHSVTLEYESNQLEPHNNVFTFTYVYKAEVDYRVEYRYVETGQLIESAPGNGQVNKKTTDGVVTERFAPVENYIPDAFFKRLILAVEKDEDGNIISSPSNVIIFYYSRNTSSAYYAVHYMLQNVGADEETTYDKASGKFVNYTESAAHTEGIGDVGETCQIPPQAFSGFTVKDTALIDRTQETDLKSGSSGSYFEITVSASGTELYIFYTRNIHTYKVYHLKYGMDISNIDSLTKDSAGVFDIIGPTDAQFGATVTASAGNIGGMTCISPLTQSILIRSNDSQNYIIFYYTPVQTTVEYRVWDYGGGTLSKTLEVFDAEAKTIEGSVTTPLDGYTFEGWYLDAACTVPANGADGKGTVTTEKDGVRFMPDSNKLAVMPQVNVFYAKFMPKNGSLTITRENGENDESDGTQVFVYKITAKNDPSYVIYVSITGNGSVTVYDLPCREYTVEQQNGWSWRYNDPSQSVTVKDSGSEATFKDPAAKQNLLSGNSERIINRKER